MMGLQFHSVGEGCHQPKGFGFRAFILLFCTRIRCLYPLFVDFSQLGRSAVPDSRSRERGQMGCVLGAYIHLVCFLPRRIFETFAYSSHLSLHNHLRLRSFHSWLRHLRRRSAAVLTRLFRVGQVASRVEARAASQAWDSLWEAGA